MTDERLATVFRILCGGIQAGNLKGTLHEVRSRPWMDGCDVTDAEVIEVMSMTLAEVAARLTEV